MEGTHISNKFQKRDRLNSHKAIEALFEHGKVHHIYPFRLVFSFTAECSDCGMITMIAVPKKHLKLSVDRNKMKRLIREALRTQNHSLKAYLEQNKIRLELAIIFTSRKLLKFSDVSQGMESTLRFLLATIQSSDRNELLPMEIKPDSSTSQ